MASGNPSGGDTTQTIGLQLAMAFGQGTGTMLATAGALLKAFNTYGASFDDKAASWEDFELRALEYARALGQVAAYAAVKNGRCVIDVDDVQYALGIVQANTLRPLSVCDLTGGGPKHPKGPRLPKRPPK
jgi:hypothetical protein